ncbi:MAG: deoxyribose-phosphate aldolase [Anaerovoracaceae bacterium]
MKEINEYIDHTILKPEATRADIKKLCDEAMYYNFATVCINSHYVPLAREILFDSDVNICTVVGFPLGAMATEAKVFEAGYCLNNGANEIDMVANIGAIKEGNWKLYADDIYSVAKITYEHDALLKVIIETCLLTNAEIFEACRIAVEAGADFVKTSTGFSSGGAKVEHIKLMKEAVHGEALVKASGGIRDLKTANEMIEAGADRLGISASVGIMHETGK